MPTRLISFLVPLLLALALGGCRLVERSDEEARLPPAHAVPPDAGADPDPDDPPPPPPALTVGDEFWAGEGTLAYELSARFHSRASRTLTLDPAQPLGRIGDRQWELGDILVSVDYRGGATRATWRVAGDPAVVDPYVARLREDATERAALLDLGVLPLVVNRWGGETPAVLPET